MLTISMGHDTSSTLIIVLEGTFALRSYGRMLGISHLGLKSFKHITWYSCPTGDLLVSHNVSASISLLPNNSTPNFFLHRQIFDVPWVEEFPLFRDRLCLLQHRLAKFRPERWRVVFTGGYAQPVYRGVVWFIITVVTLVLASIVATILVNVLVGH